MSAVIVCDYCGRTIDEQASVTVRASGFMFDPDTHRRAWESYDVGHYHSDPGDGDGDQSCFRRLLDGVDLVEEFGGNLERIPVASGQAIAAKRRRHRKSLPGREQT